MQPALKLGMGRIYSLNSRLQNKHLEAPYKIRKKNQDNNLGLRYTSLYVTGRIHLYIHILVVYTNLGGHADLVISTKRLLTAPNVHTRKKNVHQWRELPMMAGKKKQLT